MKKLKAIINLGLFVFILLNINSLTAKDIKCDYCEKDISGKYVILDGKNYHQECYNEHIKPRCAACGRVIDGEYNYDENGKYHPRCYKNHILPKCSVCSKPLEGEYLIDPWGNQYHSQHKHKNSNCSVCNRILSEKTSKGSHRVGDRIICGYCSEHAITNDGQFELRELKIKELFARQAGIRNIPDDIQFVLLSKQKDLNKIANTRGDKIKGFTKYEARTLGNHRVSRNYKIYVLSHLPQVVFDAVLAHELLHVYLFENEISLSTAETEGFCNLGSDLIYRNDHSELARQKLQNMQEDPDPDYGKGYRMMKGRLDQQGWKALLKSF